MTHDAAFILEKETKNTYRFKEKTEEGKPPIIGTIYVQKWAFATAPKELKVTIEADI